MFELAKPKENIVNSNTPCYYEPHNINHSRNASPSTVENCSARTTSSDAPKDTRVMMLAMVRQHNTQSARTERSRHLKRNGISSRSLYARPSCARVEFESAVGESCPLPAVSCQLRLSALARERDGDSSPCVQETYLVWQHKVFLEAKECKVTVVWAVLVLEQCCICRCHQPMLDHPSPASRPRVSVTWKRHKLTDMVNFRLHHRTRII